MSNAKVGGQVALTGGVCDEPPVNVNTVYGRHSLEHVSLNTNMIRRVGYGTNHQPIMWTIKVVSW